MIRYWHRELSDIMTSALTMRQLADAAYRAAYEGDLDRLKTLAGQGAPLKPRLVHAAASRGDLDMVKFLHERGADIHAEYDTALCNAARNDRKDVVEYLLAQGADIHTMEELPLRWAATEGHVGLVRYLHEQGAKVSGMDSLKYAFVSAAENGHAEVVDYMKRHGAKLSDLPKKARRDFKAAMTDREEARARAAFGSYRRRIIDGKFPHL